MAICLGVVCVVLVGVIYLFISFYLAVMRTVQVLAAASQQLATGQMDQLIVLDNTDELGQVVRSFNHVAAALFKANQDITELNRRLGSREPAHGGGTGRYPTLAGNDSQKSRNSRPFRAWRSPASCNRPPKSGVTITTCPGGWPDQDRHG